MNPVEKILGKKLSKDKYSKNASWEDAVRETESKKRVGIHSGPNPDDGHILVPDEEYDGRWCKTCGMRTYLHKGWNKVPGANPR